MSSTASSETKCQQPDSQDSSESPEFLHIVYYKKIKPAKTIIFTEEFDGIISDIPEGVENIEIRNARYQSLLCLPKSLKSLYIGCDLVEVQLPDSLEHLELGSSFRGRIRDNKWPESLRSLSVYDANIDSLPSSLEYLKLNTDKIYKRIGNRLPKSLKALIVPPHCDDLWLDDFRNLEYLEYKYSACCAMHSISPINRIPPSLKVLKGPNVRYDIGVCQSFPDSIEYLMGYFWAGSLFPLPKSLRIFINPDYQIVDSSILPESLEYLHVSSIEDPKPVSSLSKLKTLICNTCPKGLILPPSLEYLQIKTKGTIQGKLPDSLKTLIVPKSTLSSEIVFPEKLEVLEITETGLSLRIESELKIVTLK